MSAVAMVPDRVLARLLERVTIDPETGCHISTYSRGSHGYAQVGWNENGERIVTVAHRAVWIGLHGPIADGMTVDHTCYNRPCINPEHLRLLTLRDNSRRWGGQDWPLGECKNGHPDSEMFWNGRAWECHPCHLARVTRANHRRRGAPKRLQSV